MGAWAWAWVAYGVWAWAGAGAQEACVARAPCSCVFPNGTGVDLTPGLGSAARAGFLQAQRYAAGASLKLTTYYYHPCTDLLYNATDKSAEDKCNETLALCRHTVEMTQSNTSFHITSNNYEKIGLSTHTTFSKDARFVIYNNGPSNTTMLLVCAPDATDSLQITSEEEPNALVLTYYSPTACLRVIDDISHRSLGSTLLIVFFTMLIFYLVLGVCTKKFLMGAQGLEVVPNLSFWLDLPNLCRDGWMFVRAGFRVPTSPGPATSPDPNSYDSI